MKSVQTWFLFVLMGLYLVLSGWLKVKPKVLSGEKTFKNAGLSVRFMSEVTVPAFHSLSPGIRFHKHCVLTVNVAMTTAVLLWTVWLHTAGKHTCIHPHNLQNWTNLTHAKRNGWSRKREKKSSQRDECAPWWLIYTRQKCTQTLFRLMSFLISLK